MGSSIYILRQVALSYTLEPLYNRGKIVTMSPAYIVVLGPV